MRAISTAARPWQAQAVASARPSPWRGALRRPVTCRATPGAAPYTGSSGGSGSSASGGFRSGGGGGGAAATTPPVDAAQLQRRLEDLQELLREAVQVAVATGPRGLARSAQAARALLGLAREQALRLQAGQAPEGPAVILRKAFERLGATYIKLGQFIASSPTLFPEEYVLEFQKCLDATEPVPFETIRCVGGVVWQLVEAGAGPRCPARPCAGLGTAPVQAVKGSWNSLPRCLRPLAAGAPWRRSWAWRWRTCSPAWSGSRWPPRPSRRCAGWGGLAAPVLQ